MKKASYIIVALIIISTITVFAIGPQKLMIWFVKPSQSFAEDTRVAAPDYNKMVMWAAHPEIEDPSDLRPEGIAPDTTLSDINVFFIHPTGYLRGAHWNSPMDPNSATEENTKHMLANQASAFSDCDVYAPRYREASIFSFLDTDGKDGEAALDLAYQDVASAFDHFINSYNGGQPFILASHSQGTYHAIRLLKDKIDQTPLANQMIVAYIIGMSTVTEEAVAALQNITVCDEPDKTNCLIHWSTFSELYTNQEGWNTAMICVNPLTWKTDGKKGGKELNKGAVPFTGDYNLTIMGEDVAAGEVFQSLAKPQPGYTYATCVNGKLLIENQIDASDSMGKGNYHGLDYRLFHINIRENVKTRVAAYREKTNKTGEVSMAM